MNVLGLLVLAAIGLAWWHVLGWLSDQTVAVLLARFTGNSVYQGHAVLAAVEALVLGLYLGVVITRLADRIGAR